MAGFPGDDEDIRAGGAGLALAGNPAAPLYSIVDVAKKFEMAVEADRASDGIPNAVVLDDTTGTFAFDRALCLGDDFEKDVEPDADYWDFHASGFYVPVGPCPVAPWKADRYWQRARAKAQAATPKRLGHRFWFDDVAAGTGYASPSLMSVAAITGHDLSDGDPVSPRTGIATLIQGYFDATDSPGDAVLHAPPILAPDLFADGVVRIVNGRAVGPLDIPVSFGPYPSQVGLDGADIADVSSTYVVITGTVYAEAGEVVSAAEGGSHGRLASSPRQNAHIAIAERRFVYAFDPGPVFAVKVYVPSVAQAPLEEA